MKYEIDYIGLEKYIKTLKYFEIETTWNKPKTPKLIEGVSIVDLEYFKTDILNIPHEKIIQHGDPFLVDILGNDLSIVILSKKMYKQPNGRVVNAKFVKTIITDCRTLFGTPLNGYWKIPNQFMTKLK
jgi:hypothetical protein